ncbi:MAG: OmpH family outer membrane protein [Vicinamibacteria bacterium]
MRAHRRLAWILGAVALLPASLSRSEEGADPRRDMEVLEAMLDRVVRQVSSASASPFLGATEASRAYHLPGYGTLFVVPPRVLPHAGKVVIVRKNGPGSEVEWSSDTAPDPAASEAMARATAELRKEQRRIENEMEAETRSRSRQSREKDLRAIEEQVEALQKEAQRTRQDAERAFERAVREVQIRLAPTEAVAPEAPPPPPSPVAPVAPPAPLPPQPPWHYWFDREELEDVRTPDRIIADVKSALSQTLETQGGRLHSVRPDEFIAVAVDFVAPWEFDGGTRPEKTLVIRIRKRDLDERGAGKIGAEELRKRFEFVEY